MGTVGSKITNVRCQLIPSWREPPEAPKIPGASRVIVEATKPPTYHVTRGKSPKELVLKIVNAGLNMPAGTVKVRDGLVSSIQMFEPTPGRADITINLETATTYTTHFETGIPARLIVDLDRSVFKPLFANARILIDPGHGGREPQAFSVTGLPESQVTLDVALRLESLLAQVGARTLLTRREDIAVPLEERVKQAIREAPDLILSIHTDVGPASSKPGPCCYHGNSPAARRLAGYLEEELVAKSSLPDRGIAEIDPGLWTRVQTPVVLVELAPIGSRLQEGLLRGWDFRQKLAQALFNGLRRYQAEKARIPSSSLNCSWQQIIPKTIPGIK